MKKQETFTEEETKQLVGKETIARTIEASLA